jgi:hypothetical protein
MVEESTDNIIFLRIIQEFPELFEITKPKYNKLISYGYIFDFKLVYSLLWIYKYYLFENNQTVYLFLPKQLNIESSLKSFNESIIQNEEYFLDSENVIMCSLEQIENIPSTKNDLIIFGFANFIFSEICEINKRRLNTNLNKIKGKIHILSYSSLNVLEISALINYSSYQFNKTFDFDFNLIDILDSDSDLNDSVLVEMINELLTNNKTIYISLNLEINKILQFEKLLISHGIPVSKKELDLPHGVVLNSSKPIEKSFLKNKYSVYIFLFPNFSILPFGRERIPVVPAGSRNTSFRSGTNTHSPLNILSYLKEIHNDSEVFIESSSIKNTESCLRSIKNKKVIIPDVIKDSREFNNYDELLKELGEKESLIVTESYYNFKTPDSFLKLNLSNLKMSDYSQIRNFVKQKLSNKMDLEIKTCQLSAPCSPKDRSKKLNSLSNKISSYDYRCDVTCEIFKDYTIGVVVWNETFANRKEINLSILKNQTFVYQLTNGNWKYTTIN